MNARSPIKAPSKRPSVSSVVAEQTLCLDLKRQGKTREEICQITGLNPHQVKRRLSGAYKAERLDPDILSRLRAKGLTDLSGLHSGWLLEKDESGSGSSLYFHLGPDQEKISFAEAMKEVLSEIPALPPLEAPSFDPRGTDKANFVMLADLHVGGDYGDPQLEEDFNDAIDDLVSSMPRAEKAYLMELGDLLDANDHKGVTPASGNPCDVKRDFTLSNTKTAIRLMIRAILRLAETHEEVEVYLIPGNHDPSAYVAVLMALEAWFKDNKRIRIVVPQNQLEESFRVVSWGKCAVFPHHGHTAKWEGYRDVWVELFADEWAAAKAYRLIATAHFHHDRKRDLGGCTAEHFRTLHKPNKWALEKGLLNRGSLTAITLHKEKGETNRTIYSILTSLRERLQ